MPQEFEVKLRVLDNKLPIVLDVLRNAAVLISVMPVEKPANETVVEKPKKTFRFVNGKRNKGIFGRDLLKKIMTEPRPYSMDELTKAFVEHGFAETSVSPNITILRKQNAIRTTPDGKYILVREQPTLFTAR